MKFAVTNGANKAANLAFLAQKWAASLQVPYITRQKNEKISLAVLLEENALDCLLVATNRGPQLYSREGKLVYHPSMAVLRVEALLAGREDNFTKACALKPGMRFLDATLGLASDAAIAAFVVGVTGQVIGLEASKPLWFLVKRGLASYKCKNSSLTASLRRIIAIHAEAGEYLRTLPADSFDVVYFDPMFKFPIKASSSMQPLRPVSYAGRLNKNILQEALRVAPRVVVKERFWHILQQLGIEEICGGKYSRVQYGILRR